MLRCAHEIVGVAPACGFLGVYGGGLPFADESWDVGEVAGEMLEVGKESSFVGVGTPDCVTPGVEDELVGRVVVELDTPWLGGVGGGTDEVLGC